MEPEDIPTFSELDVPSGTETPTNRELQLMIKNQSRSSNERHQQLMKTLGGISSSISSITTEHADQKKNIDLLFTWKNFVVSAIGLVIGFLAFIFPYFIAFIKEQIKLTVNSSVTQIVPGALSQELKKYDISLTKE